jgi:signal transduction histidine kinase
VAPATGGDAGHTTLLLEMSVAASDATTPEEAAHAVMSFAARVLGATAAVLAKPAGDGAVLELADSIDLPDPLATAWQRIPVAACTPLGDVARSRQPVFVESSNALHERHPDTFDALNATGIAAVAAVPVGGEDQLRAVLGFLFAAAHEFDAHEREFIQALGLLCAQAILRARSSQAERQARAAAQRAADRARRLQTVTAALSRALSPRQVNEVIVQQVFEALGASGGAVLQISDDRTEFFLVHAVGSPDHGLEWHRRFSVNAPIPVRDVLRTSEPVFLESKEEWASRYELDPTVTGGAFAALPLIADDRLRGALTLVFPEPRAFGAEDREFTMALANHCAQALERARLYADAVAANEAKANFIAVISHELRTPLTAVLGYTELLGTGVVGPITPVQKRHLDRIHSGASHLLHLIEDLLRFARIDAGKETVQPRPVILRDLVEEVAALIRPLAEQKGLSFELRLEPVPLEVRTDPAKVKQILINLLANAVKFTTEGGVTLRVRTDRQRMIFEVADTGAGISPEHINHVFDAFWQAEQTATRGAGGTGLGLAVVREIVGLLGGELAVESAPGSGSTFRVMLPLDGASRTMVR